MCHFSQKWNHEPKLAEIELPVSTPRIHSEAKSCLAATRRGGRPAFIASIPGLLHLKLVVYRRPGNEAAMHAVMADKYARYLGLGRRYEAGVCTVVISMNGAFQ